MKTLFLALSFTFATTAAFASSETTAQKATRAFVHLQTAGLNAEVLKQTQQLAQAGFTEAGETEAVTLNGGCGFAGCAYNYLVTTTYSSKGVNPQTTTIAAIVRASTWQEVAQVTRVLPRQELTNLLKH